MGDMGARIDAEAARTGLTVDEIGDKVHNFRIIFSLDGLILYPKIFSQTEGKLVQITGLPAMYDYEFFPQIQVWPLSELKEAISK